MEGRHYFKEDTYEAVLQSEFEMMRKQYELKVTHMQEAINNDRQLFTAETFKLKLENEKLKT